MGFFTQKQLEEEAAKFIGKPVDQITEEDIQKAFDDIRKQQAKIPLPDEDIGD